MKLLAVSKKQSLEKIKALYDLGQRDFGENYAEELAQKQEALKETCPDIRWHYIGQVQSNKIKHIAKANYIHSLSKFKHAKLLALHTPHKTLSVFIQVNLSGEAHRGGVLVQELNNFVAEIQKITKLKLLGLMTILPLDTKQKPKYWFSEIQKLSKAEYPELSMGMSADFKEAIQHGATWVRIGSGLFGARD